MSGFPLVVSRKCRFSFFPDTSGSRRCTTPVECGQKLEMGSSARSQHKSGEKNATLDSWSTYVGVWHEHARRWSRPGQLVAVGRGSSSGKCSPDVSSEAGSSGPGGSGQGSSEAGGKELGGSPGGCSARGPSRSSSGCSSGGPSRCSSGCSSRGTSRPSSGGPSHSSSGSFAWQRPHANTWASNCSSPGAPASRADTLIPWPAARQQPRLGCERRCPRAPLPHRVRRDLLVGSGCGMWLESRSRHER